MKSGIAQKQPCCNVLKGVDMFGQRVNFTFKQNKTYNTSLGGCISLLCIILLGSFFVTRTSKVLSKEDPFFAMTSQVQEEGSVIEDLWDLGFYFAI